MLLILSDKAEKQNGKSKLKNGKWEVPILPVSRFFSKRDQLVTICHRLVSYFATWFGNQKERTRVLSIVLFPITIPAFLLMTILGVIPYVLFMLIKGRTTQSFYRIINVAFYVLAALVVIGEIAFASMFLI